MLNSYSALYYCKSIKVHLRTAGITNYCLAVI